MANDNPPKNKPVSVKSLFGDILPADYAEHSGLIARLQHYFDRLSGDAVYQQVRVLNATSSQLHVSLPNSMLANYFRLYEPELRQAIERDLSLRVTIKTSVQPPSSESAGTDGASAKPEIGEQVPGYLHKAVASVEGEQLQSAIRALADTLAKRRTY
jgi:hypothetical protein